MLDSYAKGYPWTASARLAQEIKAVCPAEGAQIGRWDNRATWILDALPEATDEQIAEARAVMASFEPWGESVDIGALADEDAPLEQPNIYDDEDETAPAEQADAQDEARDDPSEPEVVQAASSVDHGGIMVQPPAPPDEIYALRDYVRARVSEAKLIRLDAAADPSRRDYLASCWQDRVNLGALGQIVPDAIEQAAQEFMALERREALISAHATQLERAAGLADLDTLRAMAADIWQGGPT